MLRLLFGITDRLKVKINYLFQIYERSFFCICSSKYAAANKVCNKNQLFFVYKLF